jgi:hypothetical protein
MSYVLVECTEAWLLPASAGAAVVAEVPDTSSNYCMYMGFPSPFVDYPHHQSYVEQVGSFNSCAANRWE